MTDNELASLIRCGGRRILPPVMSDQRTAEMRIWREKAVASEQLRRSRRLVTEKTKAGNMPRAEEEEDDDDDGTARLGRSPPSRETGTPDAEVVHADGDGDGEEETSVASTIRRHSELFRSSGEEVGGHLVNGLELNHMNGFSRHHGGERKTAADSESDAFLAAMSKYDARRAVGSAASWSGCSLESRLRAGVDDRRPAPVENGIPAVSSSSPPPPAPRPAVAPEPAASDGEHVLAGPRPPLTQSPPPNRPSCPGVVERKFLTDNVNAALGFDPPDWTAPASISSSSSDHVRAPVLDPSVRKFLATHNLVDHIDEAMGLDKSIPVPQKPKPAQPPNVIPPALIQSAIFDHVSGLIGDSSASTGGKSSELKAEFLRVENIRLDDATVPGVQRVGEDEEPLSLSEVAAMSGMDLDSSVPIIRAYLETLRGRRQTSASDGANNSVSEPASVRVNGSAEPPLSNGVGPDEESGREEAVVVRFDGSAAVEMEEEEGVGCGSTGVVPARYSASDGRAESPVPAGTSRSSAPRPDLNVDIEELERRHQEQLEQLLAAQRAERQRILAEYEAVADSKRQSGRGAQEDEKDDHAAMRGLSKTPATRLSFASTLDGLTMEETVATPVPDHCDESREPVSIIFLPDGAFEPAMRRLWCRVTALARGYLTRRLLRTDKVLNLVREIKETALVAHSLGKSPEDVALRGRLVSQLRLDVERFHNIFFKLSPKERMTMISHDRAGKKEKEMRMSCRSLKSSSSCGPRTGSRTGGSRRLSAPGRNAK